MILLDLAKMAGVEPKWAASTQGGEYHSACPACGGKDRFYMQPNKVLRKCSGYYACRGCGKSGDSIQFCIDFLGLTFKDAAKQIGIELDEAQSIFQKTSAVTALPLVAPSSLWVEKAGLFVEWAHQNLLQQPDILKDLEQRGVPLEAVKRYKIGWCRQEFSRHPNEWGINRDGDRPIWFSRGIVIPTMEKNGSVMRIKIRRHNYKEGDKIPKYVAVAGSMNGLNIIGDTAKSVMVVVESELDAYAIHHVVGDLVVVIAVGSNIKNPDNVTDYYAKKVSSLLICYDNDVAGKKMFDKWKRLFSHAKGCPTSIGKDVGDAVKLGLNLKEWMLKSIDF